GVLILFVGIIYQSLFWYKMGATPGQWLMGLRVRNVLDVAQPLKMSQCMMRSIFWWLNILVAGIPFLSVYSHSQRRPLHDRVADTLVVSVRKRHTAVPSVNEQVIFKS